MRWGEKVSGKEVTSSCSVYGEEETFLMLSAHIETPTYTHKHTQTQTHAYTHTQIEMHTPQMR